MIPHHAATGRLLILALASALAATAGPMIAAAAAARPAPVVESPEGRRAFVDLAGTYGERGQPVPVEAELAALAGDDVPARQSAGRYILALLQQSLADETNGRAPPRATAFWGEAPVSPARQFRVDLARQLAQAPPVEELLPAAQWLIDSDPLADNQLAGARLLCAIPSPRAVEAIGRILAPAHNNQHVLVAAIDAAGDRSLKELAGRVTPLALDPRTPVRQAVARAAPALAIGPLPEFDPAASLKPFIAGELQAVGRMLPTAIGPEATWSRLTIAPPPTRPGDGAEARPVVFEAWVLRQDGPTYRILDLFGRERAVPREGVTVARASLAETAAGLLRLRGGDNARAALSAGGPLTAQFEPAFVSLPEVLVAAWLLERGDAATAAALILPRYDAAADQRWIRWVARDLLARQYFQQMLDAFTYQRDYNAVARIGRHLSRPEFEGWPDQALAAELTAQVLARGADFATLTLPTPAQWKQMQQEMNRPDQIAYLGQRLRLLNAFQWGQPGGVDFHAPQYRVPALGDQEPPAEAEVINPLVELEALRLEIKDLPALLPFVDDENFILAYGYWRDFHPARTLFRVGQFAAGLLNNAAHRVLIDYAQYQAAAPETRATMLQGARQWITTHAALTREQLLLEDIRQATTFAQVESAAVELARAKNPAVIDALLSRWDDFREPRQRGFMVECAYRANPAAVVERARGWINDRGLIRFWSAMILLSAGDPQRLEGLEALRTELATDGPDLQLHRHAFDLLLRSGREELIRLACGVLDRISPETSSHWATPLLHRLLLAGRAEALDYLLRNLADDTPVGKLSGTYLGQSVTIEQTNGDRAAALVADLRGEDYRYPWGAPDEQRQAERRKLATWLTEQFNAIKAGRPAELRPRAADLLDARWRTEE